jgi:DNA-binding CsgD family transcriptional regulator
VLFGRDSERAVIDAVLASAGTEGRPAVLVLRGPPGVGKTALLEDVAARWPDVRLLRAQGLESECEVPFAGLHQLLRPLLGHLAALLPAQAHALRSAFGLEAGCHQDRFVTSVAALSLLAEEAATTPVCCLIDDAHWLDAASAAALLFVAHRLGTDRIALLFAVRDVPDRRFDAPGLPELPLGGLDEEAAGLLLRHAAGGDVEPGVAAELVRRTDGNPLALVELPGVLGPAVLSGKDTLPSALPMSDHLQQAFLDQVLRLTEPTRRLLLVAAADDTQRTSVILAAAGEAGIDPAALDAAERSGLVRVRAGELTFRHPLVRSAVYQSATTGERQAAHRALACALQRADDPDRLAWHRAWGVTGPDAFAAAELEQAAARVLARGGHAAAAAALERAADLTPDHEVRAQRLAAAGESAWRAGRLGRAAGLLATAGTLTDQRLLRADIEHLRGAIELGAGSARTAVRILVPAAREVASVDVGRALRMLALAADAAGQASDAAAMVELVSLGSSLSPGEGAREQALSALLAACGAFAAGDLSHLVGRLRTTVGLAESTGDEEMLVLAGRAALGIEDAAAHRLLSTAVARQRARGAISELLPPLTRLALAEILTGRWGSARTTAHEALQLSQATGHRELSAFPLAWLALLAGIKGHAADLRTSTEAAEQVITTHPVGLAADTLHWARGSFELGAGRPSAALAHFRQVTDPTVAFLSALDRIETATMAECTGLVGDWLRPLEQFAASTDLAWAAARAVYCQALLAGPDSAGPLFREALARASEAARPFERARMELGYGSFLRRRRRRVDAREHLRGALAVFDSLGATPWAERARIELRATGEIPRSRDPSQMRRLTPQEVQVARLVAEGLATRDVAAHLFLSPRTVDFHLHNIFTKTGITSRTELARLPLE